MYIFNNKLIFFLISLFNQFLMYFFKLFVSVSVCYINNKGESKGNFIIPIQRYYW